MWIEGLMGDIKLYYYKFYNTKGWYCIMFKFSNYIHLENICNKLMRDRSIEFSQESRQKILELAQFSYKTYIQLNIDKEVSTKVRSSMELVTHFVKHTPYEQELLYYLPTIKTYIEEYNLLEFTIDNVDNIENWYQACIMIGLPHFTSDTIGVLKDTIKIPFGLYKLYDSNKELIYIGGSNEEDNLGKSILHAMRRLLITADYISYAETQSAVDTNIYKAYYIGGFKPRLNTNLIEDDKPTVVIDELCFSSLARIINR